MNKWILEHINKLFKLNNNVYKQENNSELRISGLKNCLKILNYFDNYPLLTKKKEIYKIWKKILLEIQKNNHLENKLELKKLIKFMKNI